MPRGRNLFTPQRFQIAHSPDADDAFMFFALTQGHVRVQGPEPCVCDVVSADIQTLNLRALAGGPDMLQISAAAYPAVADRYRITGCGASMGLNYGPVVVAHERLLPGQLQSARVAIPGELTTAYLLARIYLPAFKPVPMAFDTVLDAAVENRVDAAVVIHEGQLTYADHGLNKVIGLGERWFEDTGLPLPLGINVVSRRLEFAWQQGLAEALAESIIYAHDNSASALAYARTFARGIDEDRSDEFTHMYVNDLTRGMGERGVAGLRALFTRARSAGIVGEIPTLDVLHLPGGTPSSSQNRRMPPVTP